MCAAARVDPETGSRCRGHFRGASRAVATPMRHEQREALLGREPPVIAPKVHFLNSALPTLCHGVCMSGQNRIDAAPLSAPDDTCARAERTPESVER